VKVTAGSKGSLGASVRTDAEGRASFHGLADGDYTVEVREPGFVYVKAEVAVVGSATPRINLLEPEGWTARVRVVDAVGRPIPFARLDVRAVGPAYVLLEDGVQMLALWTDSQGEAVLPRLPDGPASVKAVYGTRAAELELTPATPSGLIRLPEPR